MYVRRTSNSQLKLKEQQLTLSVSNKNLVDKITVDFEIVYNAVEMSIKTKLE